VSLHFRVDACVGCHMCELICSIAKNGSIGPRRARIRIVTPEPGIFDFAKVCIQCKEPPCLKACPVYAITKGEGVTRVNEDLCIGCDICAKVCPVEGIKLDPKTRKAIVCDLCNGDPICVKWCPTEALKYVKTEEVVP